MRILLYKDNLSSGRGADRAVCNLVNALAVRGHRTTLVTYQPAEVPFSCHFDAAVKIIHVPRPRPHGLQKLKAKLGFSDIDTSFSARLADVINAEEPEIVISAGTNELVDLTRTQTLRPPIVQQLHIYPPTLFKRRQFRRNARIRAAFSHIAAVQVLLPSHVAALRETLGDALSASTPVTVIGNVSAFTVPPPPDVPQEPIILYPAALTPGKRQDLLIEAFARVADRHPDWFLHLYGTGGAAYTQKLAELIAARHLEKRVILKGWCADLSEAYASCAFVAFPSAAEGFPLTILDAAAFKKPVLGCDSTPSVSELIKPGETGLLAAPEPETFAVALAALMDDTSLRTRLGSGAYAVCAAAYAPDTIFKTWIDFLTAVSAKRALV